MNITIRVIDTVPTEGHPPVRLVQTHLGGTVQAGGKEWASALPTGDKTPLEVYDLTLKLVADGIKAALDAAQEQTT